jgi:ubiquinone/menaquinone biosynthesis C-methylase UbiE
VKFTFLTDVKQEMPDWVARAYASQIADGSQALYERLVGELIPRLTDVAKVIDVGCGPGHATELLASRLPHADVLGVDLSEVLIGIAKRKREPRTNLRFEVGNALDMHHPDGAFDAATSFMSIKAWPDRQKGVQKMARVVRPGGWVALFECDPDCSRQAAQNFCAMWRWNLGLPGHVTARMGRTWYFRRFVARGGARSDELQAFLEGAGLIELESFSRSDQPMAFAIGRKP